MVEEVSTVERDRNEMKWKCEQKQNNQKTKLNVNLSWMFWPEMDARGGLVRGLCGNHGSDN